MDDAKTDDDGHAGKTKEETHLLSRFRGGKKAATEPENADSTDHGRQLIYGTWRGTWRSLLRSFVHLPALMMTAVILWINHASIFWFDQNGISRLSRSSINNILNSLQLLAKIYEISVVASLAHITIKAYKRRLVGKGLPAGMLTGGYRVGDIFYLLSRGFRGGRGGAALLAVFLAINTILSVLVGPASAILIIPELGWFPVRQPFKSGAMPVFMERPEVHWPEVLDESAVTNGTDCLREQANYQIKCPGSGFGSLYTWASGWATAGLPGRILLPDHSGVTTRQLDMHTSTDSGTFATVPMSVVASTIGQLQSRIRYDFTGHISVIDQYKLDLAEDAPSSFYQPLVNSICFVWNMDDHDYQGEARTGDEDRIRPESFFECFSDDQDDACHLTRDDLGRQLSNIRLPSRNNDTGTIYRFYINQDEGGEAITSPILTAQLPYIIRDTDNENRILIAGERFVACSAAAHWIPTSFGVEPNATDVVRTNITDLSLFSGRDRWRATPSGELINKAIRIDKSWLKYVDPSISASNSSGVEDEERLQQGNDTEVSQSSTRLSLLLGAFLSESDISDDLPHRYVEPGSAEASSTDDLDDLITELDEDVRITFEKFFGAVLADAISRTSAIIDPLMLIRNDTFEGGLQHVSLSKVHPRKNWQTFSSYFDTLVDERLDEKFGRQTGQLSPDAEEFLSQQRETRVMLDFDAHRYGYGFGNGSGDSKETVTFALVVVYAYIAVLVSYAVFVTVQRCVAVDAWEDLQDLMALAWTSPAPHEIANQGSGVRNKRFWKENATIRATASDIITLGQEKDQRDAARLVRDRKYK